MSKPPSEKIGAVQRDSGADIKSARRPQDADRDETQRADQYAERTCERRDDFLEDAFHGLENAAASRSLSIGI